MSVKIVLAKAFARANVDAELPIFEKFLAHPQKYICRGRRPKIRFDEDVLMFKTKGECAVILTKDGRVMNYAKQNTGAIIDNPHGVGLLCAQNGDEGGAGLEESPTISFKCLARFFAPKELSEKHLTKLAVSILQKGTILDYSLDEYRDLTPKQLLKVKTDRKARASSPSKRATGREICPPEAGFVLGGLGERWHRSGSFLFTYQGKTVLLGVDEDSYFGCELPEKAKTLKHAYTCLVPKQIRNKPFTRQGEWFAVPVDKKDVPDITEAIVFAEDIVENLCLQVDDPDSARHILSATKIIVAQGKVFAQDPLLSHSREEHEQLDLKGWYTFVKNTAIRSFSEEGVD